MRIAVLANLKDNAPVWEGMSPDQWDDLDSPKTVQAVIEALEKGGHRAEFLEAAIGAPHRLVDRLERYRPELCFNIAEGHFGDGREAQVPSVLEMLRLPYTGSRVLALALALDKPMTKRLLHYHDLPTPEFQVFAAAEEPVSGDLLEGDHLRFPLFVKPSREGTGMGVSSASIVRSVPELRERVGEQLERYRQPVLCERFIEGRELTVGLVGNLLRPAARRLNDRTAPRHLPPELALFPPLEVDMSAYEPAEAGLYTNRVKVELVDRWRYFCPAPLEAEQERQLYRLAAAVFRVMGCLDVARVDFRLDAGQGGRPYVLEVNPLPGLNPVYSDLPVEAYAAGWTYERLINTMVELACRRWGLGGGG